jgi:23S rRNA (adenine2503-C2)-methyltransferase
MGFGGRRVTLSTAGWIPRIPDLGRDTGINLAVSLNAVDNSLRTRLMPINRRFPIEKLLAACRRYPLKPTRRITFEYVLLSGTNDSPAEARRLAALLRPLRCKINLIPFNPFEGSPFRSPAESAVQAFRDELVRDGYTVIVRRSKGRDISAACGQLSYRRNPRIAT